MHYLKSNLSFIRKRFDVTQSQLAYRLKKSQSTIGGWENGVAEPNIESLLDISEIFGITTDYLLKIDLSHGNLITDQHVKEFQANGNLIGNPIGNLKTIFPGFKLSEYERKPSKKEEQSVTEWTVINILKQMDGKLDGIRVVADKILDKTPRK